MVYCPAFVGVYIAERIPPAETPAQKNIREYGMQLVSENSQFTFMVSETVPLLVYCVKAIYYWKVLQAPTG